MDKEDAAVAAAHGVNPDRWWAGFGVLIDCDRGRFTGTNHAGTPPR